MSDATERLIKDWLISIEQTDDALTSLGRTYMQEYTGDSSESSERIPRPSDTPSGTVLHTVLTFPSVLASKTSM